MKTGDIRPPYPLVGYSPQTSIPGATTDSVFKLDEVLTLYLLMMSAGVILELAEFHSSSF